MSTLIKSSNKCPMCRRKYKKPHAEAQAADANFMIRIARERFRGYSLTIHIERVSFVILNFHCSFTNSFVGVLISFSFSLLQLCEEQHPGVTNSKSCIACIYFDKGLNPIQQHEFVFAIQCIFTCRTVNGDHENCDHCQRLIDKVYKYF